MGKTKIKTIGEEPKAPEAVKESTVGAEHVLPSDKAKKEKVSKRAAKKTLQQAQGKPKQRGKKYQEKARLVDPNKKYPVTEAVKLTQEASYSKFPGTLEAHINTNVKNLRGLVSLPHLSGKKLTILVFGQGADKAGADLVGTEEIISQIEAGKINFDIVVTTPDWMPKLAKVAKILGPKGLMPNPKNGTISDNIEKAVTELQTGKIEYKTEANGQVIHLAVGKVDQNPEEIVANLKVIYNTVGRSKIQKITLSSTMGPGVKVDLSSI